MMVATILQMVISATPARTLVNCGGSREGSVNPGGRGRLTSSSTVASTIPAPRSAPPITFLPTLARSWSWPVFTGQRSEPGWSRSPTGGGAAGAASGGAGAAPSPAAALICAATAALTTGRELTSVIGPAPTGVGGGTGPGGTGGCGGGVTGPGPGLGAGCALPVRPNTT